MSNNVENREYKSDVFSMLMKYPEYALDVYNALNNSNFTDPNVVEFKTLDKGIFLTVRNDAAFIIDMNLSIYEHQSTYNPNMPLRVLIYLADIYKPMIQSRALYGRKRVTIPKPQFVVFYNGTENRPEVEEQRLSDAYEHGEDDVSLELICKVYNINADKNEDIKGKSYVLAGYMQFVDKVRENISNNDEHAVKNAIKYCIENNILKEFFEEKEKEIIAVMEIDMSFKKQIELERQDSFEDGKKEGMEQGLEQGMEQGLEQGMEKGLMLDKIEMIILKVKKNKPLIQTASELEKEPEAIKEMYDIVVANPGKAAEEIYDIIQKADLIAK